nr:MAG TPA: hypothetical protein [Caudoviricetes sp.]
MKRYPFLVALFFRFVGLCISDTDLFLYPVMVALRVRRQT